MFAHASCLLWVGEPVVGLSAVSTLSILQGGNLVVAHGALLRRRAFFAVSKCALACLTLLSVKSEAILALGASVLTAHCAVSALGALHTLAALESVALGALQASWVCFSCEFAACALLDSLYFVTGATLVGQWVETITSHTLVAS